MKAASVFPSEFNQFATAFCKIWFLLSERSSLLTKKKKQENFISLDIAHVQSMQMYLTCTTTSLFTHTFTVLYHTSCFRL